MADKSKVKEKKLTPREEYHLKQARKIQMEAKQRRAGGVKSILSNRRMRGRETNKILKKVK